MKKHEKDKLKKITAGAIALLLALIMILGVLAPILSSFN